MLEELVSKDDTETKKKKLSEQYDLVMDDKLERQVNDMGKKKREHIVFDQMEKPKKTIPFSMVNKQNAKNKKKK